MRIGRSLILSAFVIRSIKLIAQCLIQIYYRRFTYLTTHQSSCFLGIFKVGFYFFHLVIWRNWGGYFLFYFLFDWRSWHYFFFDHRLYLEAARTFFWSLLLISFTELFSLFRYNKWGNLIFVIKFVDCKEVDSFLGTCFQHFLDHWLWFFCKRSIIFPINWLWNRRANFIIQIYEHGLQRHLRRFPINLVQVTSDVTFALSPAVLPGDCFD